MCVVGVFIVAAAAAPTTVADASLSEVRFFICHLFMQLFWHENFDSKVAQYMTTVHWFRRIIGEKRKKRR